MSLVNFLQRRGEPPEECRALRAWLQELVQAMVVSADLIRCSSGPVIPTYQDLEDLWVLCDVPPGAIVVWYHTTLGEAYIYTCIEGSIVGCNWTLLTLP